MIKNNEILFLIRSYNEWEHLLNTIKSIKEAGFDNVLIIDDGSTDWTYEKLNERNDIIYLRHLINRGWWAALETWFEFIRRNYKKIWIKYVVSFDADWQHNIEDLDNFISVFKNNQDIEVVIGSRFLKKTYKNMPFFRKIILSLWKIFTYLFSDIKISDPHNGYRMFKVSAIKKIKLTMDWFEYASELVDQISQKNIKFKEVPVNIIYTDYSLSKWQKSSNAINIALKMIWNKFLK